MGRNKRPLTQSEFIGQFARETSMTISKGQVSKDVSAGMPLTSFADAMAWRTANKDRSRPKAKMAVRPAGQPPKAIPTGCAGDEPTLGASTLDMNAARALDIHYSAELRRRKLLEFDREHISRAEVEAAWDAANTMYRQGLEGVAGRTASIIAGLTGGEAVRIEEIIRDEHRAVLSAVADLFDKAAVLAESGTISDVDAVDNA